MDLGDLSRELVLGRGLRRSRPGPSEVVVAGGPVHLQHPAHSLNALGVLVFANETAADHRSPSRLRRETVSPDASDLIEQRWWDTA